MNCQFCQQECKQQNTSHWHMCESCKVFFNDSKREIIFRPNSDTHWYWLVIDFDADSTKIDVIRDPKTIPVKDQAEMIYTGPRTILQLDHALQGVTPQNMHDKLKLLLVFS